MIGLEAARRKPSGDLKTLDRFYLEFESLKNFWWVGSLVSIISRILSQPKILTKVIPRFGTKLGTGRPFLRWTIHPSQVQYLKSRPSFVRGELFACYPRSLVVDTATGAHQPSGSMRVGGMAILLPSSLGW
jgi:hypothetical protein